MKDEIRYKLKIKRKYFQGVRRTYADEVILNYFLQAYGGFDSFFVYNSFGTEADTKVLISALITLGKRVYLPRVEGESIVAVPFGQTSAGAFGVEEPTGQAFSGDIQVTVVPLLAVNPRGFRTGYGKGCYDRYFKSAKTLKVGLGYSFQQEEFPEDGWDEPLDEFICEKGIVKYAKN